MLVACALQTPKLINKYWVSMRNDKIAQSFTEFISAVAKGYSSLTFGASRLVWFFSSPRRKQEAKKIRSKRPQLYLDWEYYHKLFQFKNHNEGNCFTGLVVRLVMRLIFTSRKGYWQLTKGKFFSPRSARANANKYYDKTKTPFVPQWTDDWFIDYTSVITPPRLGSFNVDPGATLLHKGRTIKKVIGGGGGWGGCGRRTKKYSRKGKWNEKKLMHTN